jgi:hypothetical protein
MYGIRGAKPYLQYYGTDHIIAPKLVGMQAKEADGVKILDELAIGTALDLHYYFASLPLPPLAGEFIQLGGLALL